MNAKRILSMVLVIVLAVSLFAGFTGTAYADDTQVITHTVASGEYLYKICTNYGLNYDTCKQAIMLLNGFTSATQLSRIYAGQVIKLPASDAIAATVRNETVVGNTTTTSSTASSSTASTTTSTATKTATTGDSVAYYLVQHTVTTGETLSGICNSVGSSYEQYANTILTINGLSNPTHVFAGKVIYLPVSTVPTGSTYYTVVAHRVASGETTYAICNNYGINYSNNKTLVDGLNQGYNMSAIKVGQVIYIPTSKTVSASSTTGTSTASATAYSITVNAGSGSGTAYATVNGSVVGSATMDTTVVIQASASTTAVMSIEKVLRADTKAAIKFDDTTNSFTMPNCAVEVVVNFTQGIPINKKVDTSDGTGSFETYSNDSVASFTAPGKTVTIKTTPSVGCVTKAIREDGIVISVNGTAISAAKAKLKMVSNNTYTFVVPDSATDSVGVEVSFEKAVTYDTEVRYCTSTNVADMTREKSTKNSTLGSAAVEVDGTEVVSVASGTVVVVDATPVTGYVAGSVRYLSADGNSYQKATKLSDNEWTFTMPKYADDAFKNTNDKALVLVAFERNDVYNINTELAADLGSVTYRVLDDNDTEEDLSDDTFVVTNTAKAGETVYFSITSEAWFKVELYSIKYANGTATVSLDNNGKADAWGYYEFTMPASSVTVSTKVTQDNVARYGIWHDTSSTISFETFRKDGQNLVATNAFAKGDTVVLMNVSDCYRTVTYYLFNGYNYELLTPNKAGVVSFTMPECAVAVLAIADSVKAAEISALADDEYGSLTVYSGGTEVAESISGYTGEVYCGNKVTFEVETSSDDYEIEKVLVYEDGELLEDVDPLAYAEGYPIGNGDSYTFEAVFKDQKSAYTATVATSSHATVQIKRVKGLSSLSNELKNVKAGETIEVSVTSIGSDVTLKSITVIPLDKNKEPIGEGYTIDVNPVNGGYKASFTMPSSNVQVSAEFEESYKATVYYDEDCKYQTSKLGSASLEVDNEGVVSGELIAVGDTVIVRAFPATGYTVDSIKYKVGNGTFTKATKRASTEWSFEMPEGDVSIYVSFVRSDSYSITTSLMGGYGSVSYRVKDDDGNYVLTTSAKANDKVYMAVSSEKWYKVTVASITCANGTGTIDVPKKANSDGYYEFVMPASDVTVTTSASIDYINRFTIWHDYSSTATFQTFIKDTDGNLIATESFAEGDKVFLKATNTNAKVKYYVYNGYNYSLIAEDTSGLASFTMPGLDVAVIAVKQSDSATIAAVADSNYGYLTVYSSDKEVANSASGSTSEILIGNKLTFNVKTYSDSNPLESIVVYIDGVPQATTLSTTDTYTIKDAAVYTFEAVFKGATATSYEVSTDVTPSSYTSGVSVSPTTATIKSGTQVNVTAPKVTGKIAVVTVNGMELTVNEKTNIATFIMPDEKANIKVEYVDAYATTIYYDEACSKTTSDLGSAEIQVDDKAVTEVAAGDTVTVKTNAAIGYDVDAVKYKTNNTSFVKATKISDTEWTFEMPKGDTKIYVSFARTDAHTITTSLGDGLGSVTYRSKGTDGSYTVTNSFKANDTVYMSVTSPAYYNVTVKAIMCADYTSIIDVPTKLDADGYYEFTMPASDVVVTTEAKKCDTARYSIWPDSASTISFQAYVWNNGQLIATDTYEEGQTIVLKPLNENIGVDFYRLVDGEYKLMDSNQFTMPAYDVAIKAVKQNTTATISAVAASEYGSLAVYSASNKEVANSATNLTTDLGQYSEELLDNTLTFKAKTTSDNYKLTRIIVKKDGVPQTDIDDPIVNGYRIKEVAKYEFVAVFTSTNASTDTSKEVNIVPSDGSVTVAPLTGTKAAAGDTLTITATPASGETVKSITVTVDGETSPNLPLTWDGSVFTANYIMPNDDITVTAEFVEVIKVDLSYDAKYGSAIVTSGRLGVQDGYGIAGDTMTVVMTPGDGYVVKSVVGVDGLTLNGNTATFKMPDKAQTLTITFEKQYYTITAPKKDEVVGLESAIVTKNNDIAKGDDNIETVYASDNDTVRLFIMIEDGYKLESVTAGGKTYAFNEVDNSSYPNADGDGYQYYVNIDGITSDMSVGLVIIPTSAPDAE